LVNKYSHLGRRRRRKGRRSRKEREKEKDGENGITCFDGSGRQ